MTASPAFDAPARVVIVMPTFNEAENLAAVAGAALDALPQARLLVVDDASPDGTGQLADRLAAGDDRIRVLHRAGREGLGAAYLAGFAAVFGDPDLAADIIIEMDADGSHPASALPALRDRLLDDDALGLVIGSRWIEGGGIADWPRYRSLLSRAGNTYARLLLGLAVRDSTAGFRVYRATALHAAVDEVVQSHGYCFQIDLARRVDAAGFGLAEIPITFHDRVHGSSKMNARIVLEAMWRVTGWGLARMLGFGIRGKVTRNRSTLGGFPQGDVPRSAR
ncbi:polyprenol monophosphomannose synthase [uncultured Schumannella sp.]|uniref:polyprenol monophosphomannose synthase n=1 Tax=uncultured Schumannella sp. TaxID=1195956 RepID=UPI0025D20F36|nr:polyprenol monophosphomannose synthase [uncultured Schumannella sp.]